METITLKAHLELKGKGKQLEIEKMELKDEKKRLECKEMELKD